MKTFDSSKPFVQYLFIIRIHAAMKLLIVQFFFFVPYICATSDKNWWKYATIYDIHVMSFKDSNGDGIGDLAGVTSKLDYFKDFGIPAIRLSSIFSSKEKISKYYGIDNFTDIHPDVGNMDDFDELMEEAKKRNIKVILDFNFHHCHVTHEWFEKSVERIKPFDDFFIWKDPIYDQVRQIIQPPSAELTYLTGTSFWTYVEKRRQFYLSTFKNMLPDLNLQNDAVKKELKKIFDYWFDRGVCGFNLQEKYYYFPTKNYEDSNDQDLHEFLREIREHIDIYNTKETEYERILMTDGFGCDSFGLNCFGNRDFPLVHLLSNHFVYYLTRGYNYFLGYMLRHFELFAKHAKNGAVYKWSIYGTELRRRKPEHDYFNQQLHTITAVLPGVWSIFYGSELGVGGYYKRKKIYIEHDLNSEWEFLPAMPWDSSKHAGFTDSNHPMYLPMPNYQACNAEKQKDEENSLYNYFKDLLKLREKNTMKYGDFKIYSIIRDATYALVRTYKDNETYIILMHFSNTLQQVDLSKALEPIPELPPKLKVVTATPHPIYRKGSKIDISHISMRPYSATVLTTET